MERLSQDDKDTVEARINALTFSGLSGRINGGSICRYVCNILKGLAIIIIYRYHKSLLGRDFKAWAQVGIFVVWSFLSPSEKKVWLSLAKVHTCVLYTVTFKFS